jgi:hypothetical protein
VQAFAHIFASILQPHPSDPNSTPEATLTSLLETPFQLEPPVTRLKRSKVQSIITNFPTNKSPGYDPIAGRTLKELPTLGFQYLTQLFNAVLLYGYFPAQWKVAQIILIPKPGKPPHAPSSYRPISLLPIAFKVFEKLLLNRLLPLVEHGKVLPTHQFGFRPKHYTFEQTHHLNRGINNAIDNRQYCSATFLEISQTFDKIWHKGLLYKIGRSLPLNYFLILNSYLSNRHFIVRVDIEHTDLTPVNAGVPQGSVLSPLLYQYHLYTADLPTSPDSITATFANDTAVIATDYDPATASQKLQASLLEIQSWLNIWRMKANETKSVHVTFTTRRKTCPPVHINDAQIPQENHVKYLGLHLDRRLTWHTHIFAKRK